MIGEVPLINFQLANATDSPFDWFCERKREWFQLKPFTPCNCVLWKSVRWRCIVDEDLNVFAYSFWYMLVACHFNWMETLQKGLNIQLLHWLASAIIGRRCHGCRLLTTPQFSFTFYTFECVPPHARRRTLFYGRQPCGTNEGFGFSVNSISTVPTQTENDRVISLWFKYMH